MRIPIAFLSALGALAVAASLGFGQATSGASNSSASSSEEQATSAPAKPAPKSMVVSPETAAMLAAGMPKWEPPKPVKPPPPAEEQADLRDIDKPKNEIIRLPKYVVHAEKPPIFREQDLYTKDGLNGLALQRYGGLNLGNFAGLNGPIAMEMYREDQRLQSISELDDTAAAMARGGDASESQYILREAQDTYAHQMDFGGPVPGQPKPQN